jgi:tetratricopeptide (TPR) repeat protein
VLLDSSLVHRTVGADGEPRFGMLETIREDALERLEAAGEAAEARRRHQNWCLALVQPVSPELPDPARVARLISDLDNLRAALRGAIQSRDIEAGLRLAAALWVPWYFRGLYAEGRAWLSELLALPSADGPTLARAYALASAGHLAYCQGDYATAEPLLESARVLADQLGNELLGGEVLNLLANLARARGDLAGARSLYESALAIFRRLGHRIMEATVLSILARVLCEQGDLAQADACAEASLAFFTDAGNTWGMARSLYTLAGVAAAHGNHTKARAQYEASLVLQRELADPQGMAWSLVGLANEVLRNGQTSAARQLFCESLTLADKAGDQLALARSLEGLAGVMATEWPEQTVRLAGAADAARASLGAAAHSAERHDLERWLTVARRALGEAAFSAAWTAGRALGLPHAVVEALQAQGTDE